MIYSPEHEKRLHPWLQLNRTQLDRKEEGPHPEGLGGKNRNKPHVQ